MPYKIQNTISCSLKNILYEKFSNNSSNYKKSSNSFVTYLQEVKRLSKNGNLTTIQEGELVERIMTGDRKAEEELVVRNLKFVISVAKQYQSDSCLLEDLVSEGNFGLIKAAKKFDINKGCGFISYAVWWIRTSVLCYLNENGRTIRLPIKKISQLAKIKKFQAKFEQEYGRKPSTDEILDKMEIEMNFNELSNVFLIDKGVQSLNKSILHNSETDELTLESRLSDEIQINSVLENDDIKNVISRVLNKIPNRNKFVVEHYYGLNGQKKQTFLEIAEQLNVSIERVREIRNKALRYLGLRKNREFLQQYMV